MFRAARAYINICNFGYMLDKVISCTLNHAVESNIIIKNIIKYDYKSENSNSKRKYRKGKWVVIIRLLSKEYGLTILLFLLMMWKTGGFNIYGYSGGFYVISLPFVTWLILDYIYKP